MVSAAEEGGKRGTSGLPSVRVPPLRPVRGPSIYHLPLELLVAMHIRDRRSREQWKRLPLEALPPANGPVLVFDVFDEPAEWVDDWSGKTLSSNLELRELVGDQLQFRRAGNVEKRAKLAKRIRRRWCALVDHAIGYRVPGTFDVMEFST